METTQDQRNRRDDLAYLLDRLDHHICVELDLIGQRMNVLAVSQAFLFAAYTTNLAVSKFPELQTTLLYWLPMLGVGICTISFFSIVAANLVVDARKTERDVVRDTLCNHFERTTMPPEIFAGRRLAILNHVSPGTWHHSFGNWPSYVLSPMIALVWVILLARRG